MGLVPAGAVPGRAGTEREVADVICVGRTALMSTRSKAEQVSRPFRSMNQCEPKSEEGYTQRRQAAYGRSPPDPYGRTLQRVWIRTRTVSVAFIEEVRDTETLLSNAGSICPEGKRQWSRRCAVAEEISDREVRGPVA